MTINYKNGKIYKIEPKGDYDEGDVYIGSTTKQYLCQRMAQHLSEYKRFKNGIKEHSLMSFDLFDKYGDDNFDIVLLESVEANSKDELHQRESHYIRNTKCVNKYIPLRTRKQYKVDNKDKVNEQYKRYREKNKDRISERDKQYKEMNKEKITEVRKQYRLDNKVAISQKKKEKFTCDCGSTLRISDKAKHERTTKHNDFIRCSP